MLTPASRCASCMLSCVWLCNPIDCTTCQAPLLIEFSSLEYWGGLPFPVPGDLPNSGIKSMSPVLTGRLITTEPPGKSPEVQSIQIKSDGLKIGSTGFSKENKNAHTKANTCPIHWEYKSLILRSYFKIGSSYARKQFTETYNFLLSWVVY